MPSAQGHITVRRKAKDGVNGTGVTIASTSIMYATSTSGTTAPTSGWQSNVPTVTDGLYLWARTHISFSDNTELNIYSVSRMGIDGRGIQSSVVTYSLQANPVDPTTISNWGNFPSTLTDGYWLYTKTHVVYSDSSSTDSYSVSQVGTGSYYAGCQEYYAVSSSKTTAPSGYPNTKPFVDGVATYANGEVIAIGSAWSTSRPNANLTNPYIWNFEISYDSRGNKYVTQPICIGNFARGIVSIVETYTISSHTDVDDMLDDVTERSDYPWADEEHTAVPNIYEPYQWNKTVVNYNDGNPDIFYHISAIRGSDGVSVTGVQEQYARSSSNTTPPASSSYSWKNDPTSVVLTSTYKYLWNRERLSYSNGTYSDWTTPAVIGTFSKDGKSITGVIEHYLATSASSGVTRSTSGWTTYPTSENATMTPIKKYLWNYEEISYSEGNNTYTDPIIIGVYGDTGGKGDKGDDGDKGDKGDDGDDAVRRWLEPSVYEVRRYQTGDFSTPTISCAKKKQVGAGSPVEATDCTMHYTYTEGGTEHTVNNYAGGNITIGLWWSKIVFWLGFGNDVIERKTVLIIDTPTSVAANLLNGTNFSDEPDIGTRFATNKELIRDALDGQMALRCLGTFNNAAAVDFLRHRIIGTNDIRVQAATWYTLSFWAKAEPYIQENINETSGAYGFGLRTFYAEAGVEYTLRFNGYVDTQTVREERELRVFVYNDDWSWNASKATSSTTPTTLALTFTVPTTGTYKIQAYVYPSSQAGTGRATVNWYRLYRSKKLTSYVYPSLIDTSAVQVIDGVINNSHPADGYNPVALTDEFVKHTFTFKTKQTLPSESNYVLFRLPIACNGAQICMPKLERGVFATDWCRSERDKQGLSYRLVCKDSIQEGSTGCDIKVMMSYGEESKVLTYAEATAKGLAVTGTNVQWDSSHQRLYISGGASASSTYTITLTLNGTTCDLKQVTVTPNGAQGLAGCILRVSEWTTGVQYHNDESLTSGTRYLDIAVVTTGPNTFNAYKCKVTHTSSNAIPVTNTTYWQAFNELLPIYTPLIMAQNALLRFAQTNQLLVMKSDDTTVAAGLGGGMGAADEANYPLWVGATTPNSATFKVRIDGKLFATGADISGHIVATTGSFGNMVISDNCFDSNTGKLTFGILGTSYTYISTSQDELRRTANLYLANFEGGWGLVSSGTNAILAYGRVQIQGTTNLKGAITKYVKNISSNYSAEKSDSVIICKGDLNYTVTLPNNCEDGQQITILRHDTNNIRTVTIAASGTDVICSSNPLASGNNAKLVYGSITLPKPIYVRSDYDEWSGQTYQYYTRAFGVILVYDATDKIWHARYII